MIDRRVRLRPKDAAANYVYGDKSQTGSSQPSILSFLRVTNGMVWNYTPIISEQRNVNYEMEQPIHTNSGYNSYKNTSNATITIQGSFYASTGMEAMYTLACMHFLRSITQMDFGRQAALSSNPDFAVVGAPPPILLLSGYGRYIYNDIPVIIKSYQFSYPDDVSYIQVPVNSSLDGYDYSDSATRAYFENLRNVGTTNPENEVWVPQKMNITIQLEEQPTPNFMTTKFNLNSFKRGEMLRKGGFI
jgi:hypothetical protein